MQKKYFVAVLNKNEQIVGLYTDNYLITVLNIYQIVFGVINTMAITKRFVDFNVDKMAASCKLTNNVSIFVATTDYCIQGSIKNSIEFTNNECNKNGEYKIEFDLNEYQLNNLKKLGIQNTITFSDK